MHKQGHPRKSVRHRSPVDSCRSASMASARFCDIRMQTADADQAPVGVSTVPPTDCASTCSATKANKSASDHLSRSYNNLFSNSDDPAQVESAVQWAKNCLLAWCCCKWQSLKNELNFAISRAHSSPLCMHHHKQLHSPGHNHRTFTIKSVQRGHLARLLLIALCAILPANAFANNNNADPSPPSHSPTAFHHDHHRHHPMQK